MLPDTLPEGAIDAAEVIMQIETQWHPHEISAMFVSLAANAQAGNAWAYTEMQEFAAHLGRLPENQDMEDSY
jgi:hypothetical protein